MELQRISEEIKKRIEQLDELKADIFKASRAKAMSSVEYDRKLAMVMVQLRNGVEFEIDGVKVQDLPSGLIEKVAKGLCYQEALAAEVGESRYKAVACAISATESQMNGLLNMNRHQTEM
jgi:hypothetical protein